MYEILGGCHCGNISYVAEIMNEPSTYAPRACDCQLCTSHSALYASDSKGTLTINIKNIEDVSKYRIGTQIADFLICKNCGVLTNVCYKEDGSIYGNINVRSAKDYANFAESHAAHLTELSDQERIRRWKNIWFSDVKIEYENQ